MTPTLLISPMQNKQGSMKIDTMLSFQLVQWTGRSVRRGRLRLHLRFFSGESTPSVHFSGKSEATISWCSLFAFYPSQTIFGGPLVVLENTTKYFKSKRKKSLEHPLHERWVSNPNLVLLLQASISIISFGKARVSTTTSLCEKHPKILQDHLRSSKCKPLMIYHSQFL